MGQGTVSGGRGRVYSRLAKGNVILLLSILIRLAAMVWTIVIWCRLRDWRIGFPILMLALMASRQILTLAKLSEGRSVLTMGQPSELPGLAVSVMALLAVFFLERMFEEHKRAQSERERLIEELQRSNAELEWFSYTVSHDLKTPLVTIGGFAGLVEQDAERGDARALRRDVGSIRKAVGHMKGLLNEVLRLSRVGQQPTHREEVDLGALARESVELLSGKIKERGIEVRIDPELPVVKGDRTRLGEALTNLVDNAVKFAGPGPGRKIEIGCRRGDDEVVYYVRDNGIGIDPDHQEKIFDLFSRLGFSEDGTGVGLALVRRIFDTHGGRIWVESAGEGTGSEFCFVLPQEVGSGWSDSTTTERPDRTT